MKNKKFLLLVFLSFAVGVIWGEVLMEKVYSLNLSRVKTWSAEVLTHTDLNAEFDNILSHSLTNSDIDAAAAIVASKLDLSVPGAIGGTTPAAGAFTTLSATGAVTTSSTFTSGGTIASDTDNTDDLGSSSKEWKDLYIDGTANIDTAVITAASGFSTFTASGDLDIGSHEFKAQTFESDVATSTAPFTIASTTVSTNLNADLLDGSSGAAYNPSTIEDFGTSGTTSTTKTETAVKISYGTRTVGANDTETVTGLPTYTATTSYVCTCSMNDSGDLPEDCGVLRDSGTQITIRNSQSTQRNISWFCFGT